MVQFVWLIPLGAMVGAFGTLIGAGGGFVLMPILLLVYPQEKAEVLTFLSLEHFTLECIRTTGTSCGRRNRTLPPERL